MFQSIEKVTIEATTEEGLPNSYDQKMYGDMCNRLAALVQKITSVFPAFEAVQPPKSGIQALCGLHWALDKANSFLQQVLNSSKLYLAITNDSVLVKFERVKNCLDQSLKCLQLNVPESLAQEVAMLVAELEETTCELTSSDQDAGNKIISLLQKEKESPGYNALTELEVFDEIALELGITSSKAVLAEKKALRRLLDKVRHEEDKKKELIALYLLHLLRKYGKVHTFPTVEDGSCHDVSSSCPASPSERGSEASTSGRDSDLSSELSCFEVPRKGSRCLGQALMPPEEFRCPISLQLMADPVIVSSGQTYERICIEKWFEEGHDTCPKTQQKLSHLDITPNYCVKGLITSWCERQSIPLPNPPSPPPSPIANWRWGLLSESANKKSFNTHLQANEMEENEFLCTECEQVTGKVNGSCNFCSQLLLATRHFSLTQETSENMLNDGNKDIQDLMERLCSSSLDVKCRAVEEIRSLTKDNADARVLLGRLGCIPALVELLSTAIKAGDEDSQVTACFALSNLTVNNSRNREELVHAGVIPLLLKLFSSHAALAAREAAILVLLTVSCVGENKLRMGLSAAVPFLVDHTEGGSTQGVKDAVSTLYNLSAFSENQLCLINANAISKLTGLLSLGDADLTGKCLTILYSLSSIAEGRDCMMEDGVCLPSLVEILESGSLREKEQVAAIFLVICTNSSHHTQSMLKEGIIPSLVMLSVSGSARGKDKAQKLLQHFREQRQKEGICHSAPQVTCPSTNDGGSRHGHNHNPGRALYGRKTGSGATFGFFRRSKSLSFYRC